MKSYLSHLPLLALALALVCAGPAWGADSEATLAQEVTATDSTAVPTPVSDTARAVPEPVFVPGSDAGGAGAQYKIQIGKEDPQNIVMWDHLCCTVPGGCDCVYWPGANCNLFGCRGKTPGNC